MREPILGPLPRDGPQRPVQVDLGLGHVSDLIPPLACQNEQPNDAAMMIIPAGVPDSGKLVIGDDVLS